MKAICIYSQKDKKHFDKLFDHLHVSRHHQNMKIIPHEHPNVKNSNFNKDINDADIVFLLVSVDSINISSWRKYTNLSVKRQKEIPVVPIRIDATPWIKKSFEKLKSLPDGKSINDRSWKNQSEAFTSIAKDIYQLGEVVNQSINLREIQKQEKQRRDMQEKELKDSLFYKQNQKNIESGIIISVIGVLGILLFGKLISPNNTCSSKIKPEIYLQQGEEQEKSRNFQKAIEQYTCAIQFQSNYFEAYANRGKIYFNQGDYEVAISDFSKVLNDDRLEREYIVFFLHRKGEANRKIWEINQNEQNKKDALKNYDKVIELNKEYAYAYFGRGELYKSSGEKTLALSNFQRALFYFKKNPNEKRNVKLAEEKIKELK